MNMHNSESVHQEGEGGCGAFRRLESSVGSDLYTVRGGKCLQEELLEKRCLHDNFARKRGNSVALGETDTGTDLLSRSAGSPKGKPRLRDGDCLWAEAFAFGPNPAQKEVAADRRKAKQCYKISHNLSKCLAKFLEICGNVYKRMHTISGPGVVAQRSIDRCFHHVRTSRNGNACVCV